MEMERLLHKLLNKLLKLTNEYIMLNKLVPDSVHRTLPIVQQERGFEQNARSTEHKHKHMQNPSTNKTQTNFQPEALVSTFV